MKKMDGTWKSGRLIGALLVATLATLTLHSSGCGVEQQGVAPVEDIPVGGKGKADGCSPRRFGLIIIGEGKTPGGHGSGSGSSSRSMVKALFDTRRMGMDRVIILDAADEGWQPDRWLVKNQIRDLHLTGCDELVIYFSGHSNRTNGMWLNNLDDTFDAWPNSEFIDYDQWAEIFAAVSQEYKLSKVIMILDTCYAERVTQGIVRTWTQRHAGKPYDHLDLMAVHSTRAADYAHSSSTKYFWRGNGSWFTQVKLGELKEAAEREEGEGRTWAWRWRLLQYKIRNITGTTLYRSNLLLGAMEQQTSGLDGYNSWRPLCACTSPF